MQKLFAIILTLIAAAKAGVVDPVTRCGGVGTQLQLRISDCSGRCSLRPGTVYDCENDFMPSSSSPSLDLRVEICMNAGFCTVIINTVLPNSSVQPGFIYTAKYTVVPNDVLAGQVVEFRASILHSDNLRVEVCVAADVDILPLIK
ncbi:uncharacterized protein LOC110857907 [Folsomia candida]|uniref:Uncharacterized protein n=1 Tax=Folsomia candida TaxID=158441 RepID=A0A226DK89_FOLCA|nr:uncharacterized protein LOC110857907 [Folsomia candida]OXA44606.1 hypothetical protein Fcan01_20743 [Folsomia candida]